MARYCRNCGSKIEEGYNFCKSCGAEVQNPEDSPYERPQKPEKSYRIWIILGYVLAIVAPLLGGILSIYLMTREEKKPKRHGKFILVLAILVWIISNFIVNVILL